MPSPRSAAVSLRPATPQDRLLLEAWDRDPAVEAASGTDGRMDWARDLSRDVDWREILIAEEAGRPFGLVVTIDAAREETHYWGDVERGVHAIDIWVGAPGDRGRGLGGETMRQALARAFRDPSVTAVLVDPLVENRRAHRFYERAGFRRVEERTFGGDDCVVYRIERDVFEQRRQAA